MNPMNPTTLLLLLPGSVWLSLCLTLSLCVCDCLQVTKSFPRFHHSSFLGGGPVDAAGMFT